MAKLTDSLANTRTNARLGEPVRRIEDQRLLIGRGLYVDDLILPGTAFAFVARSPFSHARIRSIDRTAALSAPGVLAVLTGEDVIREGLSGISCSTFPRQPIGRFYCSEQPILAVDKVRHVGDRVALVIAETLSKAKDGAELLEVDYEVLPSVTLSNAANPDAPKVWDDAQSNVSFQLEFGDRGAVERCFSTAAHTTRIAVHYPRASANTIEPRGALAQPDPSASRFTVYSSTQFPFRLREVVSEVLKISEFSIRVVAQDVGGAFGMKSQIYPEEVLVVWAASKLGRPVKWTAERAEAMASDMHGRHQIVDAELALDSSGRILAFRTAIRIDVGAYLSDSAGVPPQNACTSYPSTYDIPLVHACVSAMFTNTSQLGPYRGSAKPEATFVLERLVEKAGQETGIDPIDMRRRNLIHPSQMPYKTPGIYTYDCGDFEPVLDKTIALADWNGFPARRTASEKRGVRRGIGLAMHCQRAGSASERMEIRIAPNGSAAVYAGTLSTGQGHETMFAQMVSEWLCIPVDQIRVFQGDTDRVLFGRGTFAQRTMAAGGSALKLAADEVLRNGRRLAAWMLEVSETDVVFDGGVFRVSGTDREISFREVAQKSFAPSGNPKEFGIGLEGVGFHEGPYTFPNGCMVCEVEVDPETGVIKVERLASVDDVGFVVNPLTLRGQLHGSVAHGIGEALIEEVLYDRDSGQLLTGSFLDYAMPRADIMPNVIDELALLPTTVNPLGVKGGSEAGNVATPAAIINAVVDALGPWGIKDVPIPATPERIWRAIRSVEERKALPRMPPDVL
jgi:aerobic carbon-monoxide dehydrogenase large subunit